MGNIPNIFKQIVYCPRQRWLTRAVVGTTFACLSATISMRFYWEPQLTVGTFMQTDLRVPKTTKTVDLEGTFQAKEQARQETPQIYRIDSDANNSAVQHLEELLLLGDQIRSLAGQMPYVSTSVLSYDMQVYLRQLPETNWQALQKQVSLLEQSQQPEELPQTIAITKSLHTNRVSNQAITELVTRKLEIPNAEYQKLLVELTNARQKYSAAAAKLSEGPQIFRPHLLEVGATDWELDKYTVRQVLGELLAFGIVPGLPEEIKHYRLASQRNLPIEPNRREIVIGLLNAVVIPNLKPDYTATAKQASKAAERVEKTVVFQEGQLIVGAGKQITKEEFVILDRLGLTKRHTNWQGVAAVIAILALGILIFVQVHQSRWLKIKLKTGDIAAIAIVTNAVALASVLLVPSWVAFLPLAVLGLITGSFYGSRLATLITGLLAVPLFIGVNATLISYLPILVGAIVASVLTDRPHTRSRIASVGIGVAVVQAFVYVVLAITTGSVTPAVIAAIALNYAGCGLISSIIALGAIPYLEQICYTLTPIRLAELANLDRPLLRMLVTNAPGTFQHTLFVANLAEAAARKLDADTALVRTGTLYHDIGKMLQPDFFIENQMGQPNPHDNLNDPWRSAQIIKEHVTGGLRLAQKYRLPQILQTFIPEHQGTITISYFHHQAKARSLEVRESDFRYAGPIPQSRETGIVMLADACEAALRSLGGETTVAEAEVMVLRIFQARWDDGQLQDCGLTVEELDKIAPVFIKIWQERNHGRIKYPPLAQKLDPTGSALPGQTFKLLESTVQLEKL